MLYNVQYTYRFFYMLFVMKSNSRQHIKKKTNCRPDATEMYCERTRMQFFFVRKLMLFVLFVVLIHVFKPMSCPFLTIFCVKRTRGLRGGTCNIKEHYTETYSTLQDIALQGFMFSFLGKISFKPLINIFVSSNKNQTWCFIGPHVRNQISCKIIIYHFFNWSLWTR